MAQTHSATTHITEVSRVIVTVTDQDRAVDFYCDKLGFTKLCDIPYGEGYRWIEVAPAGSRAAISLVVPMGGNTPGGNTPGGNTGVILSSTDLEADHTELRARGVDVDAEIMRGNDTVPSMFWFRDQDGNILLIVEATQA